MKILKSSDRKKKINKLKKMIKKKKLKNTKKDMTILIGMNLKPKANDETSCSKMESEHISAHDRKQNNMSSIIMESNPENSMSNQPSIVKAESCAASRENKPIIERDSINLSAEINVKNYSDEKMQVENVNLTKKKNNNEKEEIPNHEEIPINSGNKINDIDEIEKPVNSDNELNNIEVFGPKKLKNAKVHTYCIGNKVLLIMEPIAKFHIYGKLKIQVLYGNIDVYGATFNRMNTLKSIEVYSPRFYNFVPIINISNGINDNNDNMWDTLKEEGIDLDISSSLVTMLKNCETGWAVLLLEKLENNLTKFLSTYYPLKLFPKIEYTGNYLWNEQKKANMLLQTFLQPECINKGLRTDKTWIAYMTQKIINKSMNRRKCMILGGKNVGKSTMMRHIINSVIQQSGKAILLDLDVGQAECTPCGCVSLNIIEGPLLGPNFTHLQTPYYQLYLGEIDVSRCITKYFEAVKKLVDCMENDTNLLDLPVVVNTMGFCQGMGLDIAVYTIKVLQPTDVIQIQASNPKLNFADLLSKEFINAKTVNCIKYGIKNLNCNHTCDYELHIINSFAKTDCEIKTSWKIEPYQQRELVIVAYLSQMMSNIRKVSHDSMMSINNVIPYTVPLSELYVSLIRASVPPSHILAVMNGNIVGLCGIDVENIESNVEKISTGPTVLIRAPLATCYGHGIVRGIDAERNRIYIVTPVPLETMKHVNCLISATSTPECLLQLKELKNPYVGSNNSLPTSQDSRR